MIDLNPKEIRVRHIEEEIGVVGVIEKVENPEIRIISMSFECPSCKTIIKVLQITDKIKEPTKCLCGRKKDFIIISKEIIDVQRLYIKDVKLEEHGVYPFLEVVLKEDLVSHEHSLKVGKKIKILGELKAKNIEKSHPNIQEYYLEAEDIFSF